MPTGHRVLVMVPFTIEEFESLWAVANAQGDSIVELIRARVSRPWDDTRARFSAEEDDLTSAMARLEGIRIRARGRGRE